MSSSANNQIPSTKKLDNTAIEPHINHNQGLGIISFKFLVRENGGIIEVPPLEQLAIGRRGSMNHVDVDLADHEARDLGVSRNHCMIEYTGDRVLLRDLESINGTFLNGQQLAPLRGYEVTHGDEIKLGRMHLLIFFIGNQFEELI